MRLSTVIGDVRKRSKIRLGLVATFCCLSLLVAPTTFADLIGVEWEGMLYRVSTSNASLLPIGNTGITEIGSLELATDGYLYGFSCGSGATLYKINPSDASASTIGPLGIGFVFEGGLAFAPDETAYGTNQDWSANPMLFTINLNTGAASLIGTISGGSHDIGGLAWRSDGKLVGLDRESNSLLEIDPVTAASSVIAAVSPTVGVAGGMTVLGDTAYFSTSGPGSGPGPGSNELYSFDLFTGHHTLIGSFAPTITGIGISGLAIPEPATVLLLGLGGLALLRKRKK